MRCQRAGRRSEVNSREGDGGSRAPWEARETSARSAQRDNRATRHAAAPHRSATPPRAKSRRAPDASSRAMERGVTDLRSHLERGIAIRATLAHHDARNAMPSRTTRLVTRRLRASRNSRNETPPRATATQGVTDSRAHLERGRRRLARAMGGAGDTGATRRSRNAFARDRDARRRMTWRPGTRSSARVSAFRRPGLAQSRRVEARRISAHDSDIRDATPAQLARRNAFARTIATRVRTRPRSPWNLDSPTRARVSGEGGGGSRAPWEAREASARSDDRNKTAGRCSTREQRETRASLIHEKAGAPKASRPGRALVVRLARRRHPRREAREPSPRLATLAHEASAR